MKNLILLALLCTFSCSSFAQMTLAHHFPVRAYGLEIGEVNLSRSGRKIVVMETDGRYADTIFFYNPDYSFWKMIPCPYIPGHFGQFNFYKEIGSAVGIFYPSEELFNLDTLLEVAVTYNDSGGTHYIGGDIYIVNENGLLTDSIKNVSTAYVTNLLVRGDTLGNYKLYITMMNGADVYDLPGSLPCESCTSHGISIGGFGAKQSIISQPIPNPAQDKVKITFTLPEGTDMAELQLYNTEGKRINTYKVDGRFGYLMLDNTMLTQGMYYYNIVSQGVVLTTQKFVVIR